MAVSYCLTYALIYSLSLLPLWVLYRVSDLLFVVLYYLWGYRRRVVSDNLARAFPQMPAAEQRSTARAYYRHFCDLIVETLKAVSLSDAQLARRVQVVHPEVFDELVAVGKGGLVLATHYGNFEWLSSRLDLLGQGRIPSYGIYTPLKSRVMDRLMHAMRKRRGMTMIPMRGAVQQTLALIERFCMVGFMADQSPSRRERLYFTRFLGLPTAVHTSVARIALHADAPVVFAAMRKLGRGRYSVTLTLLDNQPFLPETPEHIFAYTDFQCDLLEALIREAPAYWLWSHRRWKHQPGPDDWRSTRL
ncbi:MAG: lysophospholipid acyltransferase family protein [Bacteroidia bacterium]